MKKKINKELLKNIIENLPTEVKQKMIDAQKRGKKLKITIKPKKDGEIKSPYQE